MLKKYSYKINQIPFFAGCCLQTVMQKKSAKTHRLLKNLAYCKQTKHESTKKERKIMENICVITGASCFGMHKVVQFLDERGVSLINLQGASGKRTEKEEDIVLRYTAEDETNIVLTREDIKHRMLVLTTKQTELLMQSVKARSRSGADNRLNVVQFVFPPADNISGIASLAAFAKGETEETANEYIKKMIGKPDVYIINADKNADAAGEYIMRMLAYYENESEAGPLACKMLKAELDEFMESEMERHRAEEESMYSRGKFDPYELFRNSYQISQMQSLNKKLSMITDPKLQKEIVDYQRKNRDLLAKMTKINGNAVISGDVSEIAKMLKYFLAFRLANNRPKSLELKIEEE